MGTFNSRLLNSIYFKFNCIIVCTRCVACMYVHHMHACMPSEARIEVRLLELELQMVVRHHIGSGNRTQVFSDSALNTESVHQPHCLLNFT